MSGHISDEDVLHHLKHHPGCTTISVAWILACPADQARRHLARLEKAGKVRRYHDGGRHWHWELVPEDGTPGPELAEGLLGIVADAMGQEEDR
jgi:predicted ArsR family transcriptional regulator